jgi:nucleoporin NUP159
VSTADEEEEEGQIKETGLQPAGSREPLFNKQLKKEDRDPAAKRPATPPLLSSFGGLSSGKATPIAPLAPKPEPAKTQIPFTLPSSPPPPNQQPPSVFSKPLEHSVPVKQEPPRPATTSVFGGPPKPPTPPEASKSAPTTPAASPFSLPPFSLTNKSSTVPQDIQPSSGVTSPLTKPPVFAQGGPSVFVTQPTNDQAGPGTSGTKPRAVPIQVPPSSLPIKPAAPPAPQLSIEEGLQKECALVVYMIETELKEV